MEEERCRHCGGTGIRKEEDNERMNYSTHTREWCEWCGGYGVTSWIGNITGTPEREPVIEIVRKILKPFGLKPTDDVTIQKINKVLEEAFKGTNLTIEVESLTKNSFNLKGRRKIG